jgi:trans-2,3-dihydro-3-hydroxyanthranilate isomerase
MHPYEIVDVFTDAPLEGNPLAVFTEGEQIPSRLLQAIARELNLSETVFVLPGSSDHDAHIRIFTPAAELPFAGHPTLGTACVLAAARHLDTVRLKTGAGIVEVRLTRAPGADEVMFGEMDQPIPTVEPFGNTDELLRALGVDAGAVELPIEQYTNGPTHVLVALGDAGAVANLAPDHGALERLGALGFSCFAQTSERSGRTRMFGIGVGVREDPATGSAAGPIAAHLVRHGRLASGTTIELSQGAEIGRPSTLYATAVGTGSPAQIKRVTVGGNAVRVAHGHFRFG